MYMSYYGSFVLQCYVLRMRVMTPTVGGNLSNRPPALRHIHVEKFSIILGVDDISEGSRLGIPGMEV